MSGDSAPASMYHSRSAAAQPSPTGPSLHSPHLQVPSSLRPSRFHARATPLSSHRLQPYARPAPPSPRVDYANAHAFSSPQSRLGRANPFTALPATAFDDFIGTVTDRIRRALEGPPKEPRVPRTPRVARQEKTAADSHGRIENGHMEKDERDVFGDVIVPATATGEAGSDIEAEAEQKDSELREVEVGATSFASPTRSPSPPTSSPRQAALLHNFVNAQSLFAPVAASSIASSQRAVSSPPLSFDYDDHRDSSKEDAEMDLDMFAASPTPDRDDDAAVDAQSNDSAAAQPDTFDQHKLEVEVSAAAVNVRNSDVDDDDDDDDDEDAESVRLELLPWTASTAPSTQAEDDAVADDSDDYDDERMESDNECLAREAPLAMPEPAFSETQRVEPQSPSLDQQSDERDDEAQADTLDLASSSDDAQLPLNRTPSEDGDEEMLDDEEQRAAPMGMPMASQRKALERRESARLQEQEQDEQARKESEEATEDETMSAVEGSEGTQASDLEDGDDQSLGSRIPYHLKGKGRAPTPSATSAADPSAQPDLSPRSASSSSGEPDELDRLAGFVWHPERFDLYDLDQLQRIVLACAGRCEQVQAEIEELEFAEDEEGTAMTRAKYDRIRELWSRSSKWLRRRQQEALAVGTSKRGAEAAGALDEMRRLVVLASSSDDEGRSESDRPEGSETDDDIADFDWSYDELDSYTLPQLRKILSELHGAITLSKQDGDETTAEHEELIESYNFVVEAHNRARASRSDDAGDSQSSSSDDTDDDSDGTLSDASSSWQWDSDMIDEYTVKELRHVILNLRVMVKQLLDDEDAEDSALKRACAWLDRAKAAMKRRRKEQSRQQASSPPVGNVDDGMEGDAGHHEQQSDSDAVRAVSESVREDGYEHPDQPSSGEDGPANSRDTDDEIDPQDAESLAVKRQVEAIAAQLVEMDNRGDYSSLEITSGVPLSAPEQPPPADAPLDIEIADSNAAFADAQADALSTLASFPTFPSVFDSVGSIGTNAGTPDNAVFEKPDFATAASEPFPGYPSLETAAALLRTLDQASAVIYPPVNTETASIDHPSSINQPDSSASLGAVDLTADTPSPVSQAEEEHHEDGERRSLPTSLVPEDYGSPVVSQANDELEDDRASVEHVDQLDSSPPPSAGEQDERSAAAGPEPHHKPADELGPIESVPIDDASAGVDITRDGVEQPSSEPISYNSEDDEEVEAEDFQDSRGEEGAALLLEDTSEQLHADFNLGSDSPPLSLEETAEATPTLMDSAPAATGDRAPSPPRVQGVIEAGFWDPSTPIRFGAAAAAAAVDASETRPPSTTMVEAPPPDVNVEPSSSVKTEQEVDAAISAAVAGAKELMQETAADEEEDRAGTDIEVEMDVELAAGEGVTRPDEVTSVRGASIFSEHSDHPIVHFLSSPPARPTATIGADLSKAEMDEAPDASASVVELTEDDVESDEVARSPSGANISPETVSVVQRARSAPRDLAPAPPVTQPTVESEAIDLVHHTDGNLPAYVQPEIAPVSQAAEIAPIRQDLDVLPPDRPTPEAAEASSSAAFSIQQDFNRQQQDLPTANEAPATRPTVSDVVTPEPEQSLRSANDEGDDVFDFVDYTREASEDLYDAAPAPVAEHPLDIGPGVQPGAVTRMPVESESLNDPVRAPFKTEHDERAVDTFVIAAIADADATGPPDDELEGGLRDLPLEDQSHLPSPSDVVSPLDGQEERLATPKQPVMPSPEAAERSSPEVVLPRGERDTSTQVAEEGTASPVEVRVAVEASDDELLLQPTAAQTTKRRRKRKSRSKKQGDSGQAPQDDDRRLDGGSSVPDQRNATTLSSEIAKTNEDHRFRSEEPQETNTPRRSTRLATPQLEMNSAPSTSHPSPKTLGKRLRSVDPDAPVPASPTTPKRRRGAATASPPPQDERSTASRARHHHHHDQHRHAAAGVATRSSREEGSHAPVTRSHCEMVKLSLRPAKSSSSRKPYFFCIPSCALSSSLAQDTIATMHGVNHGPMQEHDAGIPLGGGGGLIDGAADDDQDAALIEDADVRLAIRRIAGVHLLHEGVVELLP